MESTRDIIQRAIINEDKIIGDIKKQWEREGVGLQRRVSVSPSEASGNVALAYYRGRAAEREDIISLLEKSHPEAAKSLKNK